LEEHPADDRVRAGRSVDLNLHVAGDVPYQIRSVAEAREKTERS